jgi:hypothetical protein
MGIYNFQLIFSPGVPGDAVTHFSRKKGRKRKEKRMAVDERENGGNGGTTKKCDWAKTYMLIEKNLCLASWRSCFI